MFENRYITRGVLNDIPLWLQNVLWYLIDTLDMEKDYLQVFILSKDGELQKVIHRQEEPTYEKEYSFSCDTAVKAKVFVIDDKTHCTMLLAEEY